MAAGATHLLLEGAPRADGGGSGSGAPVALARRLGRIVPVGLAGGLRPENVARARCARRARRWSTPPAGSSATATGDPARIGAFVRNARREPAGGDRVDRDGRFGRFGGRFVPETLMPALEDLEAAWSAAQPRSGATAASCAGFIATSSVVRPRSSRSRPRHWRRAAERAHRSGSSARTSPTPARTRSTTRSARRCWRGEWGSRASSPRPVPASTAWRPPPPARCSASSASSTWAPPTSSARRRTSSAWGCSAPRCGRWRPATGRCETR